MGLLPLTSVKPGLQIVLKRVWYFFCLPGGVWFIVRGVLSPVLVSMPGLVPSTRLSTSCLLSPSSWLYSFLSPICSLLGWLVSLFCDSPSLIPAQQKAPPFAGWGPVVVPGVRLWAVAASLRTGEERREAWIIGLLSDSVASFVWGCRGNGEKVSGFSWAVRCLTTTAGDGFSEDGEGQESRGSSLLFLPLGSWASLLFTGQEMGHREA